MNAAERRAKNESVFREVNERLAELGEELGDDTVELVCECGDPACSEPLAIPVSVYEAVRARGRRFVVAPGHQHSELEQVVEEHPDYLVVEKSGEAGEIAEETDPRDDD